MSKLLESCQGYYQKTLGYMHLQILASIIIVLALFVTQYRLSDLKLSAKQAGDIIQSEEVKLLKDAWSLDSLILDEIGNDYRKNTVKNASELALLMTVFLAVISDGQEENKKFQDAFNLMGELSRRLNHYRQALIALEKAAIKGISFDDLNLQLLDHYHSYLLVENSKNSFDEEWTKLCKLASGFNIIRTNFMKNGGIPEDSAYKKLFASERVIDLLNWGQKQLVKQSQIPGDFKSVLENSNADTSALVADFIFRMTQVGELEEFRTLRQDSINLTYGFEPQLKASSSTISRYKDQLNLVNSGDLRQLQAMFNRDKKLIKILLEDEKIPLPFIGTSIPVSLISWILPFTNLIFLGLIIQSRYRAIKLEKRLDGENLNLLNAIQIRFLNYTKVYQSSWLWSMHRDVLGCFGLMLVSFYQLTLSLDLNTFNLIAAYFGIYIVLFFLNLYLWKYVFKSK